MPNQNNHTDFIETQSIPYTARYWEQRYKQGGDSGTGSFGNLAEFKAEVINSFINDYNIVSVIEYGCGDGNQLKLFNYPKYIGFEVSPTAISLCQEIFQNDDTKSFKLMSKYSGEKAQLTLSLDVIYHLVEDDVYNFYMKRLFESSDRFVIIYSSNTDDNPKGGTRLAKHRKFTKWIEKNLNNWKFIKHIPNRYPPNGVTGSSAEFYIYEKAY
jgi:SAM-dependent methyltransferase